MYNYLVNLTLLGDYLDIKSQLEQETQLKMSRCEGLPHRKVMNMQ